MFLPLSRPPVFSRGLPPGFASPTFLANLPSTLLCVLLFFIPMSQRSPAADCSSPRILLAHSLSLSPGPVYSTGPALAAHCRVFPGKPLSTSGKPLSAPRLPEPPIPAGPVLGAHRAAPHAGKETSGNAFKVIPSSPQCLFLFPPTSPPSLAGRNASSSPAKAKACILVLGPDCSPTSEACFENPYSDRRFW